MPPPLHHSNAHWLCQGTPCQCSCHSVDLECTLVFALGTDGKHVAIARLKQTVKLVLNATKHLSTVWTAVCQHPLPPTHLVFV